MYAPLQDSTYMSETMLSYFRQKLTTWKKELLEHNHHFFITNTTPTYEPDTVARGMIEQLHYPELSVQQYEGECLQEIDEAIQRIDNGSYGYCEHTGEPIGIKRLEACPTARLSLHAQEKIEKQYALYP